MAFNNFKDKYVLNVELEYPRVDQFYTFNSATQKSEPCDKTRPGAEKSLGFRMDKIQAAAFWKEAEAHFNECKANGADIGDFKTVHSYKENDDGTISFRAKRKAMTNAGKLNRDVALVDGQNKPLPEEDWSFGTGSRGSVKFAMYPTHNPSKKEWGISLGLEAAQVTDIAVASGGPLEFPVEEASGFGAVASKATPSFADELADDAIPF